LFEATKTIGQTLANNLTKLFHGLINQIITYDESSNLNNMMIALRFVTKCEVFNLNASFEGICFGHPFLNHFNVLILV